MLEESVKELTNKLANMECEKISKLEKVVNALCRKVLSLENELKEIKINNITSKVNETEIEVETNKEELNENVFTNKVSFDRNDIKDKCSTPKKNEDKDKSENSKEEMLSCSKCKYKCKKKTSLESMKLINVKSVKISYPHS